MPVTIACGHCRKTYRVEPATVGKKVKFKGCGEVFVAAVMGGAASPPPPPPPPPAPPRSGTPARSARPARSAAPAAPLDPYANLAAAADAERHAGPGHYDDQSSYDLAPPAIPSAPQGHMAGVPMAPPAGEMASAMCPACRSPLAVTQRLCINCGYDRHTGQRAAMAPVASHAPASSYRAPEARDEERDSRGFRVNSGFANPGIAMIESIAGTSAKYFIAACIIFFLTAVPGWAVYKAASAKSEALKRYDELSARGLRMTMSRDEAQSKMPGAGTAIVNLFFFGLAAAVGCGLVVAGMVAGSRVGAGVMRYHLPDDGFGRLGATLLAGWVIFLVYLLVQAGNLRGGFGGFMPFMTVFLGSFFLWIAWLGGTIATLIGSIGQSFSITVGAPIGFILVIVFGTLVMFPVYWFMFRLKFVESLVGFAFTYIGFLVGSLVAGPAIYGILALAASVMDKSAT